MSPKTPIPGTPTGSHLSQLDRTTQIFPEIWALPFVLNLGQLDSPENPMTVDLLCWLFSVADNQPFARFLDS